MVDVKDKIYIVFGIEIGSGDEYFVAAFSNIDKANKFASELEPNMQIYVVKEIEVQ